MNGARYIPRRFASRHITVFSPLFTRTGDSCTIVSYTYVNLEIFKGKKLVNFSDIHLLVTEKHWEQLQTRPHHLHLSELFKERGITQ